MKLETKFRVGNYRKPVTMYFTGNQILLRFQYNKKLISEIKDMDSARWNPEEKYWSIKNNARNRFQLDYLQEKNPYSPYEIDFPIYEKTDRPLYHHQKEFVAHGLTVHCGIWAAEMGTGKTLAMIELMESIPDLKNHEAWYIGPRSGVYAVELELLKWQSKVWPEMMTYERMKSIVQKWVNGTPAPRVLIFDESSKIKTPTSQRSQAALHLANATREEWGNDGYVILMSGTPAPKTPVDWWHQCEVACPGFIKEGNIHKFKRRLCIIENRESITGGVYPHIVTWLDDKEKCAECGRLSSDTRHDFMGDGYHDHKESVNEIEYLYKRMKGLVVVKFKKDCLDLPEKQYRLIQVKPTVETLRACKLINKMSKRAIESLTLLRELSDGFQYQQIKDGSQVCPNCYGTKEEYDPEEDKKIECNYCQGKGDVPKYKRVTETVASPKDQVFIDYLDEHEDIGRFIVWGGFTGTIDRLVMIAQTQGWAVLRVDGRGFTGLSATNESISDRELLISMDYSHPRYKELLEEYPRVCFIGHPQAGGMAITLTASPTALFYSNCFNGEARMQAEDRFHRAGMDANRGATIIDLVHLPTDQLVLDNLKKKKRLQNLSMGHIDDVFKTT